MRTTLIRQALLGCALLLPASAAMACSCVMYESLDDAKARAAVAVQATMVSVQRKIVQHGDAPYSEQEVVRWRVGESMRGPLVAGQEFETRTTISPAACGEQVVDVQRAQATPTPLPRTWWLFFQWIPENGAPWFVATCSRSQPVDAMAQVPAS